MMARMSFLLDPPALVATGAVASRLDLDPWTARRVRIGVVATFVGVSTALYVNARWTRPLVWLFRSETGRDWMINSGVTSFEHQRPRRWVHLLAAAMFAVYPAWYRLGERLGGR